ncbi:hypothetical protein HK103_001560 [Boothiomyces macroporosus]|uniref:Cyclic nucleotide-binding domain-containing protein n=1 Tax=Boothiomyces macroporosus TaxID=261099 RepID=A0AAD5Y584_9FUNG|nr:hypothetical protein HK103_001560 [Boothiomyces macroporosus]
MSNKTQKLLKTQDVLNRYELQLSSRVPRKTIVELEAIPPRHIIKVASEIWTKLDDYATCKSAKLLPDQHKAFKRKIFNYEKPVKQRHLEFKVAQKTTKSHQLKIKTKYVGQVHSVPVRIVPKLHVVEQEEVHEDDFSISDNASSLGSFEKLVRELNSIETGIENQPLIFQRLAKTPIVNRTTEDVKTLFDYLRPLPAFAIMNDDLLKQVCVVARIDYFQSNEIVCQAEGLVDTWMVVLSGKCQIRKLHEKQTAKHSNYPTYFINQSALVQESVPVQVIDCIVLRLDLGEYAKIHRYVQEKTREHHLKLFEEIDFCAKMTFKERITMSDFITSKAYKKDQIIQVFGQQVDKMGLVLKGSCQAFANLQDGTDVKLGTFKPGEYFNEQLYFSQSKDYKASSFFSVKALDGCEIGFIGSAELQSIIGKPIEHSEVSIISQNPDEVLYLQKQEMQAKEWKRIRKRQILGLIKEWEGNPEALGKKWRDQHRSSKPRKVLPITEKTAVKQEPLAPPERPRSCLKRNTGSAGKRVVIAVPETQDS